MLEQLRYKNHLNEVFDFGTNGIYVDSNELHDYEWAVTTKNERIAALTRTVSKRQIPVKISCETEEEGIVARNKLFEIAEKDVLAMQHGQIICGDYYFKCFVTCSKKTYYQPTKRVMEATLTVTSDYPFWVKETTVSYGAASSEEGSTQSYLDYTIDYPIDYFCDLTTRPVNNTGFVSSNFRIIIYGSCVNPSISIAGHVYQVNCTVASGEFLTIDASAKKIYLTARDGTVTNQFNNRNRKSYIFEKIPTGQSVVSWDGDFGFDIILLEERSEPKWT